MTPLSLEEEPKSPQRKIIHIDMDAFYASVEQRDNPAYRGKAIVVGGKPNSRGVVAAASYEARKFGVRSAISCSKAARLCPHAIFVKPRFEAYKEASRQIHSIFHSYTSMVEPLSLDEAYLDVTDTHYFKGSATLLANHIRQEIFEKTQLTASAGVSYNKFLAKVASDINKPNGFATITPDDAESFLENLDIGRFYGIGKATEEKMKLMGIHKGADLKKMELTELIKNFGKAGPYYFDIVRGVDHREVKPWRKRKSIGKEHTFAHDIVNLEELKSYLYELTEKVCAKAVELNKLAKTANLKLRYDDFETITRAVSFDEFTRDKESIYYDLERLLASTEAGQRPVRLIGMSISNFFDSNKDSLQLDLFLEKKL